MDSADIVIHTEYRLEVSTIHIVSDQLNGVEHLKMMVWYDMDHVLCFTTRNIHM